jgi:hypothetical protein
MGKIYIDGNGYPRYADTDELVHKKVAENKIGRELREHEVVHHKDGDKTNFRKDNLRVTSRSHHSKIHSRYDY